MDGTTEKSHEYYMQLAIEEAETGVFQDEVPVGAVIVGPDGDLLVQAHNMVEQSHTQSAHAEVLAIAQAGKKLGNWRLLGCTLYVTLEPCTMCMALIRLSRIRLVVFGAPSPLFGYRSNLKDRDIDKKESFTILEGICAQKAGDLLKNFFLKKRDA